MTLLLVDCYLDDFGCPADFVPPDTWPGEHVRVRAPHVPTDEVPVDAGPWSGIVISGSAASVLEERPWSVRLEQLVRDARARSVPVLGVCYGHQLIAKALFDCARSAELPEVGWYEIDLEPGAAADLTGPLPERFRCFVSHFDEVADPGDPTFRVLARSERCGVQAFRLVDEPVWGVQFHAEMDPVEAHALFGMRMQKGAELGIDTAAMLTMATYDESLWRSTYDGFLARLG